MKVKKINVRKLMTMILSLAIVLSLFASVSVVHAAETVKNPQINIKKAYLEIGNKLQLKITTKKAVTWESSNKKIATVSSKGLVTGKAQGTVNITATVDKKKYTCKVGVIVEGLEIKNNVVVGYTGVSEKVTIPDGVTSIGIDAFNGCKSLKTINLNKVQTIGDNAFEECEKLTTVKMDNVKYIGAAAFYNCNKLTIIKADKVKEIGNSAFGWCENLSTVKMNNVQTIGNSAFSCCINLSTVEMNNVQTIGEEAFYECEKLSTLRMNNVQTIGEYAFYNCINLSTVRMDNVKEIGTEAFDSCEALSTVEMNNVQKIGNSAFGFCKNLSTVKMNNVKEIENSAFASCEALITVEMNNVQTIGHSAFASCKSLRTVKMDSVKEIGNSAFYFCVALSTVEMNNVQKIGHSAFASCKSLTTVKMDNVKEIGDSAFYHCVALSTVEMNNVQKIGNNAFTTCKSLTTVKMDNVKEIGDSAFYHCDALSTVEMNNVKKIGNSAFYKVIYSIRVGAYKNNFTIVLTEYDRSILQKALDVIKSTINENDTEVDKVQKIHDWIVKNTEYTSDKNIVKQGEFEGQQFDQTPDNILLNGGAVCGGYANTFKFFMDLLDIECKYVEGIADNGVIIGGHAWNLVNLDGNWYVVDCTWDDPVWVGSTPDQGSNYVGYEYFLITDEKLAKSHKWDTSKYPKANGGEYTNYHK